MVVISRGVRCFTFSDVDELSRLGEHEHCKTVPLRRYPLSLQMRTLDLTGVAAAARPRRVRPRRGRAGRGRTAGGGSDRAAARLPHLARTPSARAGLAAQPAAALASAGGVGAD